MNYKTQETAYLLASELAVRLKLACTYTTVSSEAACLINTPTVSQSQSASIQVLDQRGGVADGWTDILGKIQGRFTGTWAKVIVESQGIASVAPVQASGTFSFTAPITGGTALTIGTVTLTEGVDWNKGADQNSAADAFAAAVAANATLNKIVTAVSVHGAPAVVTITAIQPGPLGNQIGISSSDASVAASGATLTGGAGGPNGTWLTFDQLEKIIGDLSRRGMRVELYATDVGTVPTIANLGSATLVGSFDPSLYWPLNART